MSRQKRLLRFLSMTVLGFILLSGYQNCSKMSEPAYVLPLTKEKSQAVPDIVKNKLEDVIDLSSLCVNYSIASNGATACELYQGNLKSQLESSLILLQKRYRSSFNGVAFIAVLNSGSVIVIKTDLTSKVIAQLSAEEIQDYRNKLARFKKELKESHVEMACIDSVTSQTDLVMNNNGHFQKFYSASSCNNSNYTPDDQPDIFDSLLTTIDIYKDYLLDILADNEGANINICPIQMVALPTCQEHEQIVCKMVLDSNSCAYQSCNCQSKPIGLCPISDPYIPNCEVGKSLVSTTSTDANGCVSQQFTCQ